MGDVVDNGQTAVEEGAESTEVTKVEETVTEGGDEVTKTPEYVPNFKYKVMEEEKEFDEFVRGAIKDKAHEDSLRDLYTKAHGLEAHKKTHETLKERVKSHYEPLEQKYSQVEQNLNAVGAMIQKKDYQSFFDTLKIPKEDILKYALELVKYEELPDEQKKVIEQQRRTEQHNAMLMQQSQTSEQQVQNYAVQVRTMQLNNELLKPEVSSLVQNFDAKAGKPGAFRDLVINHANMAYYRNQMDMPVEQAVKEVMSLYGNLVAPQIPPNPNPTIPQGGRPPIIPNVQGSGISPAKKQFKSLDEIRAHAKTIED